MKLINLLRKRYPYIQSNIPRKMNIDNHETNAGVKIIGIVRFVDG